MTSGLTLGHISAMEHAWKSEIETALEREGFSMRELSLSLGFGATYIRDAIVRGREPSASRMAAIRKKLKLESGSSISPAPAPVVGIPLRGQVSASIPVQVGETEGDWLNHDYETIPGVAGYPVEWQYGFTVEGECLNRIAAPGEVLVCLDVVASGVAIEDGDLVIVEKSAYGGQAFFRTAKRIRRTSAGYDLWPESDHPDHQTPIPITEALEGEEIAIRAKVLWVMKKP